MRHDINNFPQIQADSDGRGAKFEVAAAVATSSTSRRETPGRYWPNPRAAAAAAIRVESNEEEGYEIGISARNNNISLTRYRSVSVTAEVVAAAPPSSSPEATTSKVEAIWIIGQRK